MLEKSHYRKVKVSASVDEKCVIWGGIRSWSCYWIDFCNNWSFSLFLLLFDTGNDSETKKGYENYMYYLIVTQ